MLRVALVGCGFMGRTHYGCWNALDGVEVTAVCHRDPDRLKQMYQAGGNIDRAESRIEFDKLDAVSITLPTDLHAEFSIRALDAGLHVLCEKPMALNVDQCDDMIAAARRSRGVMQIGHCIRFWPEYAKAKQIVDGGEYGPVVAATFQRLGSVPTWSSSNWCTDEKRSGGMVLDLHIHDTDYVQYLFGMPQAVDSFGAKRADFGWSHIVTRYMYDDGKLVTAEGSWQMTPSFGFEMSFNIVLEEATLVYDSTRDPVFRIYPANDEPFTPQVEEGDGYSLEIAHFVRTINGAEVESVTTLEQSRNSVMIVEAEKESLRTGGKVCLP